MKKFDEIKSSLKDIDLNLNEQKNKLENSNNITLEINLLLEENRNNFVKLHQDLQKICPDKFPLTIKLNEKLKDTVIIHLN